MIVNLSASDETTGKNSYRRNLISGQSCPPALRLCLRQCGRRRVSTDLVFGGHNVIAENGVILAESPLFKNSRIVTELDIQRLRADRRKQTTFSVRGREGYEEVLFHLEERETKLTVLLIWLLLFPRTSGGKRSAVRRSSAFRPWG